jgi:hypothetical protein
MVEQELRFLSLSDDLIGKISSYLCDNPREVIALSLTCRYLYHLIHSRSSHLWYDIYSHHLSRGNKSLKFTPQIPWKSYFIEIYSFIRHSDDSPDSQPIHIRHIAPSALLQRSGHSINSFYQNYIIQFGGATADFIMTNTYDLFIILPDQSLQIFRIDQHFSFPYIARRWLHIGATIGFKNQRKVVIYGGMGNHALHGDLLLLELFLREDEEENGVETPQVICSRVQISPSSPSPSPRAGHSAVVWDPQRDGADSSIFIFGGKVANSSSLESLSNEIWHLDCTGCLETSHTALWRKVRPTGSPPSRRWCHSALRNQDSMIVFGGWTHAEDPQTQDPVNVFLNDLFLFDLVNEAWSEILASGVPPCPRCQAPIMFWNSLVTGSYSQEVPSNESQNSGYLAIYGGAYRSPEVTRLTSWSPEIFSSSSHSPCLSSGGYRPHALWLQSD